MDDNVELQNIKKCETPSRFYRAAFYKITLGPVVDLNSNNKFRDFHPISCSHSNPSRFYRAAFYKISLGPVVDLNSNNKFRDFHPVSCSSSNFWLKR